MTHRNSRISKSSLLLILLLILVPHLASAEQSKPEDLRWGWEVELTPFWFARGLSFFDVNALFRAHPQLAENLSDRLMDRYFESDPYGALKSLPQDLQERLTQGLTVPTSTIDRTEKPALISIPSKPLKAADGVRLPSLVDSQGEALSSSR